MLSKVWEYLILEVGLVSMDRRGFSFREDFYPPSFSELPESSNAAGSIRVIVDSSQEHVHPAFRKVLGGVLAFRSQHNRFAFAADLPVRSDYVFPVPPYPDWILAPQK